MVHAHKVVVALATLLLASLGAGAAPAGAQQTLKLEGSSRGYAIRHLSFIPGTTMLGDVELTITVRFTNAPLGIKEGLFHKFLNLQTLAVRQGFFVLTTDDGDQLYATFSGQAKILTQTTGSSHETWTIVGGVGKFANATGSGVEDATTSELPMGATPDAVIVTSKTLSGTITIPAVTATPAGGTTPAAGNTP